MDSGLYESKSSQISTPVLISSPSDQTLNVFAVHRTISGQAQLNLSSVTLYDDVTLAHRALAQASK